MSIFVAHLYSIYIYERATSVCNHFNALIRQNGPNGSTNKMAIKWRRRSKWNRVGTSRYRVYGIHITQKEQFQHGIRFAMGSLLYISYMRLHFMHSSFHTHTHIYLSEMGKDMYVRRQLCTTHVSGPSESYKYLQFIIIYPNMFSLILKFYWSHIPI